MDVGAVKIAEDSDFNMLKTLIDKDEQWKLEYDKSNIKVWIRSTSNSSINIVKMKTVFLDIKPSTIYDVLHDPEYRKEWDEHMLSSFDIGYLNPNNDVGYYAIKCPAPMKNRDFVLQRSWLDMGNEKLIINHSIYHKDYPPKKGFVRGTSHITGFVIRPSGTGAFLGYVSQTDPQGKLAPWLVNKVTQFFGPKLVKKLHKVSIKYPAWKEAQENPNHKPWYFPEQMSSPRICVEDCISTPNHKSSYTSLDESSLAPPPRQNYSDSD
ncbi:uncharacterized protein CBL_00754 [Carabus blaptoides fortunei]